MKTPHRALTIKTFLLGILVLTSVLASGRAERLRVVSNVPIAAQSSDAARLTPSGDRRGSRAGAPDGGPMTGDGYDGETPTPDPMDPIDPFNTSPPPTDNTLSPTANPATNSRRPQTPPPSTPSNQNRTPQPSRSATSQPPTPSASQQTRPPPPSSTAPSASSASGSQKNGNNNGDATSKPANGTIDVETNKPKNGTSATPTPTPTPTSPSPKPSTPTPTTKTPTQTQTPAPTPAPVVDGTATDKKPAGQSDPSKDASALSEDRSEAAAQASSNAGTVILVTMFTICSVVGVALFIAVRRKNGLNDKGPGPEPDALDLHSQTPMDGQPGAPVAYGAGAASLSPPRRRATNFTAIMNAQPTPMVAYVPTHPKPLQPPVALTSQQPQQPQPPPSQHFGALAPPGCIRFANNSVLSARDSANSLGSSGSRNATSRSEPTSGSEAPSVPAPEVQVPSGNASTSQILSDTPPLVPGFTNDSIVSSNLEYELTDDDSFRVVSHSLLPVPTPLDARLADSDGSIDFALVNEAEETKEDDDDEAGVASPNCSSVFTALELGSDAATEEEKVKHAEVALAVDDGRVTVVAAAALTPPERESDLDGPFTSFYIPREDSYSDDYARFSNDSGIRGSNDSLFSDNGSFLTPNDNSFASSGGGSFMSADGSFYSDRPTTQTP